MFFRLVDLLFLLIEVSLRSQSGAFMFMDDIARSSFLISGIFVEASLFLLFWIAQCHTVSLSCSSALPFCVLSLMYNEFIFLYQSLMLKVPIFKDELACNTGGI